MRQLAAAILFVAAWVPSSAGAAADLFPRATIWIQKAEYAYYPTRAGKDGITKELYENLVKHVPIAQTFDAASNLAAQNRMKSLAGNVGSIVPGHDPSVTTRFPRVADGVAHPMSVK